jgi:hypothetical protein
MVESSHTLEMGEIRFLIELCRLKTERVDNVVDLDGAILNTLLDLLSRSVGPNIY